jgi:hypothetical protein
MADPPAHQEEKAPPTDYGPLVEALTHWQALFELALDQAADQLDEERFPAEALRASLAEMCDLLRGVLSRSSRFPEEGGSPSQ